MKKRIALAVAFATAISIGNMVPAFATKLGAPGLVADNGCTRVGGALSITDDETVTVKVKDDGSGLLVTDAEGDLTTACSSAALTVFTGLTSVTILSEGGVTFNLENGTNVVGNFRSVSFSVQAAAVLTFDTTGLSNKYVSGTIAEETFSFGTLSGVYYAASLAFTGQSGADVVDASAVTTTRLVATGGDGDDTLKGGALNDDLTGDDGKDKLYGNAGDDDLDIDANETGGTVDDLADQAWGGAGADTITGEDTAGSVTFPNVDTAAPGDGYDSLSGFFAAVTYVDSSAAITLNLVTADGQVTSTAGNDYFETGAGGGVESFTGSAFADTMSGGGTFYGGEGADTLIGGAGADHLVGDGGADTIKGGLGSDLIVGATGADTLNGGAGDDTILGNGGDDIAYGSGGDDLIRGGKGSDQAWGGTGRNDVCSAEVTDHCEFKK